MNSFSFEIDNETFVLSGDNSPSFKYGEDKVLSNSITDISYGQPWYNRGYQAIPFMNVSDFSNLKQGLTDCIKYLVEREIETRIDNFDLSKYHEWIKTDQQHYNIVGKTRDLFPSDFNFPIENLIAKFGDALGFELTDMDPHLDIQAHIIVRINRPGSTDYNPPHKDIYEGIDGDDSYIPRFVNFWIPICGVNKKSSLAMAPSSHLLPENEILRTFEGAVISNNKYRVRMVKEWGKCNNLTRSHTDYGDALVFSSHLIHGLAVNTQKNDTRVALEFRLFKKGS
jgi:hypothetical protein